MVLIPRNNSTDMMPQTVPTAFTPPFDYSNFADSFDLSLLPGEDIQPVSPSTQLYSPNPEKSDQPKIFTTYYPSSPESESLDFAPDFNKLLGEERTGQNLQTPIYLDVPLSRSHESSAPLSPQSQGLLSPSDQFLSYRDINFYPSSPEYSIHTSSPGGSIYSKSPCDELLLGSIKQESPFCSNSTSPLPSFSPLGIREENYLSSFNAFGSPVSPANSNYSNISSPEHYSNKNDVVLESIFDKKQIKQENTVDFSEILEKLANESKNNTTLRNLLLKPTLEAPQIVPQNPKDHQLLRSVLRDTSFQKKYNLKPIDLPITVDDIKMEDIEEDQYMEYSGQITRETIDPVLNLAIEQMRKDVDSTCSILGISADPSQWTEKDVLSWVKWTSQQYGCAEPVESSWQMTGQNLLTLTERDFVSRAEQGGNLLYAQLEIWKAAYSDHDYKKWIPESISSNASSGDISEDEDEEPSQPQISDTKPTTSRGGSHIHLWQFLKDLLSNPETNGTCIRWLDRSKGVFKIEDSVKVARLWGKRKNRPAMNYDKLSRSIRQYYKKGIMKKTERSQRLVYQFCHPYCL